MRTWCSQWLLGGVLIGEVGLMVHYEGEWILLALAIALQVMVHYEGAVCHNISPRASFSSGAPMWSGCHNPLSPLSPTPEMSVCLSVCLSVCVCARHFYIKSIQMVRTTRVVSRMARKARILMRRVRKVIRMVTIASTVTIHYQDSLSYLEYCQWAQKGQIMFVTEMSHLGFFLAEQCHTQIFHIVLSHFFYPEKGPIKSKIRCFVPSGVDPASTCTVAIFVGLRHFWSQSHTHTHLYFIEGHAGPIPPHAGFCLDLEGEKAGHCQHCWDRWTQEN